MRPLGDGWPEGDLAGDALGAGTVIAWSGTLAADLFAQHPLTWMAPGRAAL